MRIFNGISIPPTEMWEFNITKVDIFQFPLVEMCKSVCTRPDPTGLLGKFSDRFSFSKHHCWIIYCLKMSLNVEASAIWNINQSCDINIYPNKGPLLWRTFAGTNGSQINSAISFFIHEIITLRISSFKYLPIRIGSS